MDFQKSIKDSIEIVKLNEKVISKVSKEKQSWKPGLLIIAIGGFLSAFAGYLAAKAMPIGILGKIAKAASLGSLISEPITAIILSFILVGVIWIMAKLLGGKGGYMELFIPVAYASIISWLTILDVIPIVGGLVNFAASVWSIVILIVIVKKVQSLSTGKAVLAVLIPLIIIILIILIILAIALVVLGTAFLGSGAINAIFQ